MSNPFGDPNTYDDDDEVSESLPTTSAAAAQALPDPLSTVEYNEVINIIINNNEEDDDDDNVSEPKKLKPDPNNSEKEDDDDDEPIILEFINAASPPRPSPRQTAVTSSASSNSAMKKIFPFRRSSSTSKGSVADASMTLRELAEQDLKLARGRILAPGDALHGNHLHTKKPKSMSIDSLDMLVGCCDNIEHYTSFHRGSLNYSNRKEHYFECILLKYGLVERNQSGRAEAQMCATRELSDSLITVGMSMDRPLDLVLREVDRRRMAAQLPDSELEQADHNLINHYLRNPRQSVFTLQPRSPASQGLPRGLNRDGEDDDNDDDCYLECLLRIAKYKTEATRRLRAVLLVTKHYREFAPRSLALVHEDPYYQEQFSHLRRNAPDQRLETAKLVALYHYILKTNWEEPTLYPMI